MSRRRRSKKEVALLILPTIALLGGCGGESMTGTGNGNGDAANVAPTLDAIADQTVVRNALNPRSVTVDLVIQDPDDDRFTVTVTSDDEAIIPGNEQTCGSGGCLLILTPVADATASVTIMVAVADGSGGQAESSFQLRVEPLRVATTDDDGAGSLRGTIAVAEPGDVIGFDTDGLFSTPQTIALLEQLVLDKSLTVEGTGAEELTVSGSNVARVFNVVDGASVTLRDLTIADGVAPVEDLEFPDGFVVQARPGGGAFVDRASTLALVNVTVRDNQATTDVAAVGLGGGVANFEGTLVLTDCDITDNPARSGGGVGALTLGGSEAATTIDGGTVAGNAATIGGGVANQATMLIRESIIVDNAADQGGGVWSLGTLAIEPNTQVTENRAESRGGGLYVEMGAVTVSGMSCVVFDNVADLEGGEIYNFGGDISGVPADRVCSNTPDDIAP